MAASDINKKLTATIESDQINKYLEQFGTTPQGGPKYRLVFTDDMFEYRKSTFAKIDDHGNVIGHKEEVQLTHKYNYMPHRWILERWYSPEEYQNEELPLSKHGYYEVFYVFEHKYEPLPLNKRVVEIIMDSLMKRSPAEIAAKMKEEAEKKEADFDKYFDDLVGEDSAMVNQLHVGDAVSFANLNGKDVQ